MENSQKNEIVHAIDRTTEAVKASGGGGGGGAVTNDGTFATPANQATANTTLNTIAGRLLSQNNNTAPDLLDGISSQILIIKSLVASLLADSSVVSTSNSSSTLLAGNATFNGSGENVIYYSTARIGVFSDQNSAVNGLIIEQSTDGNNWDFVDSYTITGGVAAVFGVPIYASLLRVRYINGAVAQNAFRIQTVFHKNDVKPSSIRPTDGRTNEIDTEEVSAYQMVYDPLNNVWNRMQTQDLYIVGASGQTASGTNLLNSAGGNTATDVISYRSFAVQVVISAGISTGSFIFEGSNDGTNFQSIPVFNQALLVPVPIITTITAASLTSFIYAGATMFRYVRLRIVTAITGGTVQAFSTFTQTPFSISQTVVAQGTAANLNVTASGSLTNIATIGTSITPGTGAANLGKAEDAVHASGDTLIGMAGVRQDLLLTPTSATNDYGYISLNRHGSVYTAGYRTGAKSYSATANISPVATPTDIFGIFGNATNTVAVTRVRISGIQTTTGTFEFILAKRTSANTGSTPVAFSVAKKDSTDVANVTIPQAYTATNPTTGSLEGNLERRYVVASSATAGLSQEYVFDFSDDYGKPIILSGITSGLCGNLNGVTLTGGQLNVTIEWIEY